MFTGIIEEVGRIARLEHHATGAKLRIAAQQVLTDATEGCSIAVNGVCLTALELAPDGFSADLAPETLNRTSLGQLSVGSPVNLERPLLPTTRLSGHIVQGHVDATGEVAEIRELGD